MTVRLSKDAGRQIPQDSRVVLTADEDVILWETKTTRRVLRHSFAPNEHDVTARVRVDLFHQRKAKGEEEWKDVDSASLSSLHADEKARFPLHGRETKKLFTTLIELYQRAGDLENILEEIGMAIGDKDSTVSVDKNQREIIQRWIDSGQQEFFELIEELGPDLLNHRLAMRQHRARLAALETFKDQLAWGVSKSPGAWSEREWEKFFYENDWIFGHGLAYHFLNVRQRQPYVGGYGLDGKGGQKSDFLMSTEGLARFVVLVEIKLPSTMLLSEVPGRGGGTSSAAYGLHRDLSDAIGQLHTNCHTWKSDIYPKLETVRQLDSENTYSYDPKSIIVAGSLAQFDSSPGDRMAKLRSFELHRRGTHHPEVITYDELFERASAMTSFDAQKKGLIPDAIDDNQSGWDDDVDDLPF